MDVAQLLEPVLTGGIKDTHFFNGRILTADDLRTMQAASRQHDAQLGKAIGDGVLQGFDVTRGPMDAAAPEKVVLHVSPGLAFDTLGDPVALASAVDLKLIISSEPTAVEGAFVVCQPPSPQFTNLGLYMLTAMPASGLEGQALMTELGTEGVGSKCVSRYTVEGVSFGMVPITLPTTPGPFRLEVSGLETLVEYQLATLQTGEITSEMFKFRNAVAALCLGVDVLDLYPRDPFVLDAGKPRYRSYGLIDELREQKLLAYCEVPIALLYWSARGVEFIDAWAVRRPLVPRSPSPAWVPLVAARRRAEALAAVLQFQDQLRDILAARATALPQLGIRAHDYFRFLPPIGILPELDPGGAGFNVAAFLHARPHRPAEFINGEQLKALVSTALEFPPVDLSQAEMVWLYRPWQNGRALDLNESVHSYVVFTSGHLSNWAIARFDVSRWDYSNYARCECE